MTSPTTCAVCGKRIRSRRRAITAKVWSEEELTVTVCSAACRDAYESGRLDGAATAGTLSRVEIMAAVVLGLNAATELARASMSRWWNDPFAMLVPLPVHVASAAILVILVVAIVRRREAARWASLVVSTLTAIAHVSVALGSRSLAVLLVPTSFAAPLFLLLVGRPRVTRQAVAMALATVLPLYVVVSLGRQVQEHLEAVAHIERVSDGAPFAASGPGGVKVRLAEGWRALRPNNGLVDWPHSELELIHARTGAAGFVVANPDCDRAALPRFQERSLEALAEAGGDPVPIGLARIDESTVELRVELHRDGAELLSFDLFREMPPSNASARPGCVWLHCLAPQRHREATRAWCREMIAGLERVPAPREDE